MAQVALGNGYTWSGDPAGGVAGFLGDIGNGLSQGYQWLTGTGQYTPGQQYRNALNANAHQFGQFGQGLQGQYMANQGGINNTIGMLNGLAQGQNSVSAEQLRQGMQQGLAAQQSMAAGASPQNAAMAARTAMNNMGRLGYGLSGQQALAGLQERQMALNALAQMQMQQSGQNLQGAGTFGQLSNSAYGTDLGNPEKPTGPAVANSLQGGFAMGGKFF